MKQKIIIIGNGAAGISAAEAILSQSIDVEITMITSENVGYYYRPMLSDYISQPTLPNRFFLHEDNWYIENNISFLKNHTVTFINTSDKSIELDNKEILFFDKLILATGSYNFIPPLKGIQFPNVMSLRTLDDANNIREIISPSKKAVIIGGGLLGLELGWQLIKSNMEVTVIEMMDRLLPKQLDTETSKIFLQQVEGTGMKIITSTGTKEIVGENNAKAVLLDNGKEIPCDYVFISIGIRADIELAKKSNIKTNRGILVDEKMRTNFEDIFAAGDCCEYDGINFGIWPEALAQGKVAGLNAVGVKNTYETVVPFNMYHGMNMKLFSMGDCGNDITTEYDIVSYDEASNHEKYFFKNNTLVGGILFGNISKLTKLKSGLANHMNKEAFLELIK